jgi:hypothetical protein
MKALPPPDSLHLPAAQGCLELGNNLEVDAELDNITASLRAHPDVLKVRWEIYAAAKKWEAALDIAAAIVQLDPDDPLGWVHRSYALHELKPATTCCASWTHSRSAPRSVTISPATSARWASPHDRHDFWAQSSPAAPFCQHSGALKSSNDVGEALRNLVATIARSTSQRKLRL